MAQNWIDEFEAAVDTFFETATDAEIDALLVKADAAHFNTITASVLQTQVSFRMAPVGVAHNRDWSRRWCEPPEDMFASDLSFEEAAPSAASSAFLQALA